MRSVRSFFIVAFLCFAALLLSSCGLATNPANTPVFTDPNVKIAELNDPSFITKLYNEALSLDPTIGQAGTQVHMGYWSVWANRGYLVSVLDAINSSSSGTNRGIWDEGVTTSASKQYPSYITMNSQEYWYERANAYGQKVVINGVAYDDPHPVTTAEADRIWGKYSENYANMAVLLKAATGNTVEVWCFVNGAKRNRVFLSYEFPALQTLESGGIVRVFFAQTSEADWTRPSDWLEGTGNAPTPLSIIMVTRQKDIFSGVNGLQNTANVVADLYREGKWGEGEEGRRSAMNELFLRCPGLRQEDYQAAFARALFLTAF